MKTKIAIKSDKLTPFGGIFPIMEQFDQLLSHTIDLTLGQRSKLFGYQYSGADTMAKSMILTINSLKQRNMTQSRHTRSFLAIVRALQ